MAGPVKTLSPISVRRILFLSWAVLKKAHPSGLVCKAVRAGLRRESDKFEIIMEIIFPKQNLGMSGEKPH